MNGKLIALTGRAGSGKTFCADVFIRDFQCIRIKFATSIKASLTQHLLTQNVPSSAVRRYTEGDLKEEPTHYLSGKSPREYMQSLGEWGRTMDENFWVNPALVRARYYIRRGHNVVIDDCRYINEAVSIIQMGGSVALIKGERGAAVPDHPSEQQLPPYLVEFVLLNYGDVFNVKQEACRIMKEMTPCEC